MRNIFIHAKSFGKIIATEKISFNTQQIDFMLQNIGNTNSYLRDDLIYNLFARGFDEDTFTFVQKQLITNELIESGNLFKAIKLGQNDSVFLRSFTALALAEIISADGKKISYLIKIGTSCFPCRLFIYLPRKILEDLFQEKVGHILLLTGAIFWQLQ